MSYRTQTQRLQQIYQECVTQAMEQNNNPPTRGYGGPEPLYASLDVEYDGNTPVHHSMLSMGIAVFKEGLKDPVDQFYVTIKPQQDCNPDPECIRKFWARYPEQWREVNTDAKEPVEAMRLLNKWLLKIRLQGQVLKWVAGPANNDWKWLDFYWHKYGPPDKEEIGFFCHDISSLNRGYIIHNNITDKKKFREAITEDRKYTHRAIDDAICQGTMYMNLRRLLNKEAQCKKSFVESYNGKPVLVTITVQPLQQTESEQQIPVKTHVPGFFPPHYVSQHQDYPWSPFSDWDSPRSLPYQTSVEQALPPESDPPECTKPVQFKSVSGPVSYRDALVSD